MAGRGAAQGGRVPVPSSSVDETMRIKFTRQLLELRDDNVKEVVFPSSLSNIERKFLHKLSEELGLKSKSHGKGEDRKITVSKKEGNANENGAPDGNSISTFELLDKTSKILRNAFPNPESVVAKGLSSGATFHNEGKSAPSAASQATAIAAAHSQAQAAMKSKPDYAAVQAKREKLPAAAFKDDVNKMIRDNQIVLVSGETGCGKTTQVPQYILDDPVAGPTARIVVTQPRRISAISVAERIAAERCEPLGRSIGYNIRLETTKSSDTQVLFVTPGVLLRKLQNDPTLEEFTHIVIDEAHERDRFTEFLIIMLRDVCMRRASLKLILMSATMHTNKLSSYFGGIPQVHLGGSVFPVQEFFLEDVLKFTDYMKDRPIFDTKGTTVDKMNAYVSNMNEYYCAQCSNGPFRSTEELGQHVAMCFSKAPVERLRNMKARKANRLNDLVTNLQNIITASDRAGMNSSDSGAAAAAGGFKTKGDNKKGSKDKSKPINFDAVEGPENLDEDDNLGSGSDTDTSWDSDDEANGDLEGVDGGHTDTTITTVREAEPEDNALIKQYQFSFDDSQVDFDLILALLRYIFKSEFAKDGSVLVFLPGWNDISLMARLLRTDSEFGGDSRYMIHQLHSGIPHKDQKLVFEPLKKGSHKIILSTNIAETSITIDDVSVVIDSGRMREKIYDPHVKLAYLKTEWVSQASARQRKGRGGRTRSGVCFHLFSRKRHTSLPAFQDSELLRMPLEEIVLQAKILNVAPGKGEDHDSVLNFLAKAMDPPHVLSVVNAVKLLQSINCLDENEGITLVGRSIAKLPMDPRIGRMIVLGSIMGCGPAVLATAAAMGYRDPFVMPTSDQQRLACNRMKLQLCRGYPSDQIGLYRAIEGFHHSFNGGYGRANEFCDKNFLSKSTMLYLKDLVQQLSSSVKDSGVDVHRAFFSRNNGNIELLMSTISMGLYPDVGMRNKGANTFKTEKGRRAKVHAGSVNAKGRGAFQAEAKANMEFVGYQDLVALSQSDRHAPGGASLSMLSTQPVSLFSLMVCCGSLVEVEPSKVSADADEVEDVTHTDHLLLSVDGWLTVRVHKESAALVKACRNVLTNSLDHVVNNPGNAIPKDLQVALEAIVDSLTAEQRVVTPTGQVADTQNNYFRSQQANAQSQRNRDYKGSGTKFNYFGGEDHKKKYRT